MVIGYRVAHKLFPVCGSHGASGYFVEGAKAYILWPVKRQGGLFISVIRAHVMKTWAISAKKENRQNYAYKRSKMQERSLFSASICQIVKGRHDKAVTIR